MRSHWPIAVAMAIGSYFAGSTPLGGGTVRFPILVLLLGLPVALGRDFGFATQSVGMVSASVLILARGQAPAWPVLRGAVVSMAYTSLLGLMITLSTTGLTPEVYENWLAAAPIVILGAPIGAVMVGIVDRRFTLRLVAALCLLQFAWAMYRARALLGTAGLLVSLVAVGACVMLFERLRAVGRAARGS